ncbi:MAG: hypothetical protein P8188_05970, partial [Gemmatimonadota bacterium]
GRSDRSGLRTVQLLFAGAVLAAGVLDIARPDVFRFIFGELDPLLVTARLASLGAVSLHRLVRRGWFGVATGRFRDHLRVAVLGALLAGPAIVMDLLGGFPRDLNVALPAALLFYPAIAVAAESAFHLIPLALLSAFRQPPAHSSSSPPLLVLGITALIEPVFQMAFGSGGAPAWITVAVGLHLLLFSVVALAIFGRLGFLGMCMFRLGYYLSWHLVWGAFRIPLLFGGDV